MAGFLEFGQRAFCGKALEGIYHYSIRFCNVETDVRDVIADKSLQNREDGGLDYVEVDGWGECLIIAQLASLRYSFSIKLNTESRKIKTKNKNLRFCLAFDLRKWQNKLSFCKGSLDVGPSI